MNWLRKIFRPKPRFRIIEGPVYSVVGKTKDGYPAWGAGLTPEIAQQLYEEFGGDPAQGELRVREVWRCD